MKQLTQNEFKKGAKKYKNIASPEQEQNHEQIMFMATDEFGNLQYSQDGSTYETINSDASVKKLKSLTPILDESELPEGQAGDIYAVLTNGNLPMHYYEYTTEWVKIDQVVDNTLVYYNGLLYIYNSTITGYFAKTSYTDTAELTNGADFVNSTQLGAVQTDVTNLQNNKLDKTDNASILYGTDSQGNQVKYGVAYNEAGKVIIRSASGEVAVPETPSADGYAASKKYVDTQVGTKQNTLSQTQLDAVNSGINSTKVGQITTNANDISSLQTAVSGKQDALSQTQLDAVNSGIDSTKVGQIATNTNDISNLQTSVGNKVDKTNTNNIVYGTDYNGDQTRIDYSSTLSTTYGVLVARANSGNIAVPETPLNDGSATSKKYVDTGLSGKQASLSQTQLDAVNSGIDSTKVGQIATNTTNISTNTGNISTIQGKIPTEASSSNQLADKNFVNSSINAFAAYYITSNAQGDPFATKSALTNATTFYSGGSVRVPTTNDYCIVLADESKQSSTGVDPTTRYTYQSSQWEYQYTINDTPLTSAQLSALNSGITSTLVTQIGTNQTDIGTLNTNKADKSATVSNVAYDGTNKKLTKTINGTTTDVVTTATLKTDMGLSTVATSGSYNDLTDTPTMPTVNNATLTIQKNGTDVTTFTANASSNATANITVPTSDSDLTNDRYVRYDTNAQDLNSTQQGNVRTNINAQETLTSGTNIKTVNGNSLLGSGDLTIQAGQQVDVQINGTSIVSNDVANIVTNTAYNASTNKIATMSDVPSVSLITTSGSESITVGSSSLNFGANAFTNTTIPTTYVSSVNGSSGALTGIVDTTSTQTLSNKTVEGLQNTGAYKIGSSNSTIASVSGTNLTLGNSSLSVNIAGSSTRPTYNSNSLALYNDMPTTTSSVTSDSTSALTSGGAYTNLVSDVTYDDTNKKLKKTKGGSTTDLVTFGANAFNSTTIPTSYVSSVNGSTGAITGIVTTSDMSGFVDFSSYSQLYSTDSVSTGSKQLKYALNLYDIMVVGIYNTNAGGWAYGMIPTWIFINNNNTSSNYWWISHGDTGQARRTAIYYVDATHIYIANKDNITKFKIWGLRGKSW